MLRKSLEKAFQFLLRRSCFLSFEQREALHWSSRSHLSSRSVRASAPSRATKMSSHGKPDLLFSSLQRTNRLLKKPSFMFYIYIRAESDCTDFTSVEPDHNGRDKLKVEQSPFFVKNG